MLAAFALVALVGVDRVCTFPFVGSDRLNHSHPWIESGSVARHRMVRFLIMFACRPAGRPSFFWKASLSIELPLTAHDPIHP